MATLDELNPGTSVRGGRAHETLGSDPVVARFERLQPDAVLPRHATMSGTGYDLRAYLTGILPELCSGGTIFSRGPDSDRDVRDGAPFIELLPTERAWIADAAVAGTGA